MANIKDVARSARVSTATVSAVLNDSAYVSPDLRSRVLTAIKALNYAPSLAARSLKHGRSQLIALAVADLGNPFFARVVWAAEAAVAAWGYSLVVFNSDEKPDAEQRILSRVRMLSCDGLMLVPVGDSTRHLQLDADSKPMPTVLFGRTVPTTRPIPSPSTMSRPGGRRRTICSTSATAASARSPGRSTSPPAEAGSTAC